MYQIFLVHLVYSRVVVFVSFSSSERFFQTAGGAETSRRSKR